MALTAANVRAGTTGALYVADTGTTLPTGATGAPAAGFGEVGYLSDDGITQSIAADQTEINGWQNADVVRVIKTSHSVTYAFTMIETNNEVLEVYYGNVVAGAVVINGDDMPHRSWVLDVIDGTTTTRVVIPDAQVTAWNDVLYQNGEEVGYGVTLTCYPDVTGNKVYIYNSDGAS